MISTHSFFREKITKKNDIIFIIKCERYERYQLHFITPVYRTIH